MKATTEEETKDENRQNCNETRNRAEEDCVLSCDAMFNHIMLNIDCPELKMVEIKQIITGHFKAHFSQPIRFQKINFSNLKFGPLTAATTPQEGAAAAEYNVA